MAPRLKGYIDNPQIEGEDPRGIAAKRAARAATAVPGMTESANPQDAADAIAELLKHFALQNNPDEPLGSDFHAGIPMHEAPESRLANRATREYVRAQTPPDFTWQEVLQMLANKAGAK